MLFDIFGIHQNVKFN